MISNAASGMKRTSERTNETRDKVREREAKTIKNNKKVVKNNPSRVREDTNSSGRYVWMSVVTLIVKRKIISSGQSISEI
jgi:hypothetical protein